MKKLPLFDYITYGFIVFHTIAAIIVSLNRYWQYQTFYFDFGIFDSAIWRASRFQLPLIDHFQLSDNLIIIFADHFNPSVLLLSPLYWLTSRSEILLIAQVLTNTAAATIAFLIAKKKLTEQSSSTVTYSCLSWICGITKCSDFRFPRSNFSTASLDDNFLVTNK